MVYQLLVRLFGNDQKKQVFNGSMAENGCGTFEDINEKALASIRELGMNAIWLTGILRHATQTSYPDFPAQHASIVKGKAGSPYAICDFLELDPDLATDPAKRWEEFEACLQRIRKAGLKTLIDFIPNHTARQYQSAEGRNRLGWDLGEKDFTHEVFHPQNNYYYFPDQALQLPANLKVEGNAFQEFPARATGNDCFRPDPSEFDWFETVKLNYGVHPWSKQGFFDPIPSTWLYMREVLLFWAEKGVDGFRCDMAELVPLEFWKWVIPSVKAKFPELVFIAEVYNPDLYRAHIWEGGFDFLYDKVGLYDVLRELCEGKGDARRITQVWQAQEGIGDHMLRFMENHDEQRMASPQVAGNPERVLPAMAVTALLGRGPVMLYAGQELGEKAEGAIGFSGDDGKTSIFDYTTVPSLAAWKQKGKWDPSRLPAEVQSLRSHYQLLMQMALKETFTHGHFFDLQYANQYQPQYPAGRCYSFLRFLDKECFLILAGFDLAGTNVRVRIPQEAWQTMGLPPKGLVETTSSSGQKDKIFIEASYESDGGSSGMLVRIPEAGYEIFQLHLLRSDA